ncbi:MAG: lipid asymmetry maintenance protein MlaB [Candidatus Omnitrophota bacterium]
MIHDFLKYHNIPYPSHLDGWIELDYARILKFRGDINHATLPQILEFREKMQKAGLPKKHLILDGKNVREIDSSTVAVLLMEMQQKDQKIGLINPPESLKAYFDIFHEQEKLKVFGSEQEAVTAFDQKEVKSAYFPRMAETLKNNKCLSLLTALIVFIVALPFFEANSTAVIYLLFFSFVLLSGIYAVSYNIRHVAGGVLLVIPTLVTAWSNMFIQDQQIMVAEMVFLVIFLIYTLSMILMHVLAVKKVKINELFGAISVYIMIGMTFGVIYALLEAFAPGSISMPEGETSPKMTAFFYFSFVSMSSTGFSGFTAVSSLSRAIVIVQVIIGVMYVSALIGKLVSANTPDDGGLFDNMEPPKLKTEFWAQELAENYFRQRTGLLIIAMSMLNYSGSVLMTVLGWPFFMDTLGTSLAVVLGGLRAGILTGIIYNLIMSWTFWEPSYWVWMFCSIFIAVMTWLFLRWGFIDLHKPLKLLWAGFVSGTLNSIVVAFITFMAGLPIYQGTMKVYHFFVNLTGNTDVASIAEKMAVEVADKSIALLLVAVAVIFIRDIFHWKKKIPAVPEVTAS